MNENKLNLYQKIQMVSLDINNLSKKMTVGTGNFSYKAVSDLDVTLAVKKSEAKYGLISIPIKQEIISSEIVKGLKKDNTESITYVDNLKMTVIIVDLDNPESFLEIESFGKGIDPGDKGFGKASTYARKYALLNAYKIATGEDPDSEKSKELLVPKTISEKRVQLENYLNLNGKVLENTLKHFNVTEISDLGEKQIEEIYNTFKVKQLL